jgi:hypothetical protein
LVHASGQRDKDGAGDDYVGSATKLLGGRNAADHIGQLPQGVIETYLASEGFGDVYEANISPQKRNAIAAARGTVAYWEQVVEAQSNKKSKPQLVSEVIAKIESTGSSAIPRLIREIVALACSRAESAE